MSRGLEIGCLLKRILAWVAGIIVSIGIIGSAITWAADQRYMRISAVQAAIEKSADESRRDTLEDEIFKITQVPESQRTDIQRALLDRYKRKIDELNAKLSRTSSGGGQ